MGFRLPIASTSRRTMGNVEGTRRHRMLLTGVYQLPFGAGRTFMTAADGRMSCWAAGI